MHNHSDSFVQPSNRTLQDLDLPPVVDTARHDLATDFYEPTLSTAVSYDRGVGYFTSNWFQHAATGITGLVANDGQARWLTSPILSAADAEALEEGYRARESDDVVMDVLDAELDALRTGLAVDTRNTLGWLIADGYIDIRIAIPTDSESAVYHDKFGLITDRAGHQLSFHGSKNDSQQAFRNHEAYTLDFDWEGESDAATVADHAARFERLWTDNMPGVSTIPLPEAAERGLLDLRSTDVPPYQQARGDGGTAPGTEDTTSDDADGEPLRDRVALRGYQSAAMQAWVENGYRGIYEMATGLGKTITAMASIDEYTDTLDQNVLVVIAVPENYLGRQWAGELREWGFDDPVMAYSSANSAWAEDLATLVMDTELGVVTPGIAITTHDSFHKEAFRSHIERAQVPCLLVVDEVHGAGTTTRQRGLTATYDARLGLSATPVRYMDEAGTEALAAYFDGTVFEYGLADGIPEYLSEYEYHPEVVELSEEEAEEYLAESQRLAATISSETASEEAVGRVAQQRAAIAKTAEGKLAALRRVLADMPDRENMLVFAHHEQMGPVTEVLNAHDIKYHQYTQDEGPKQRERLLKSFADADGGLDALVGIHCLDEGVDVSSAETAILLSSTSNPRQFVQRRGRVLRQHDGKDVARIYDFIVVPPRDRFGELLASERSLILSQLARHEEFARTAVNAAEAQETVTELRDALED
jgi:superfamily II DNA or RNA helicase